jgi:hypothetical protein
VPGCCRTLSCDALRLPKRPDENMVKSQGIKTLLHPATQRRVFNFNPGVRIRTQMSLRKKECR